MQFLFRKTDEQMKYTGNPFYFKLFCMNSEKLETRDLTHIFYREGLKFFRYFSKLTF